jgi:hypothetical protein
VVVLISCHAISWCSLTRARQSHDHYVMQPHTPTASPTLPQVVTADTSGIVRIWDLRTYNCVQTLYVEDEHDARVNGLSCFLQVRSASALVTFSCVLCTLRTQISRPINMQLRFFSLCRSRRTNVCCRRNRVSTCTTRCRRRRTATPTVCNASALITFICVFLCVTL